MTVKHWGGEAGIVWFNTHIPCSGAWDTMISYMALISTLGMMCGKVLANLVPNGIKKESVTLNGGILVDDKRWNKIVENQIKFIEVAKEWMHGCVMENVRKIKIKLENIWVDLMRSIYAPYMQHCWCELQWEGERTRFHWGGCLQFMWVKWHWQMTPNRLPSVQQQQNTGQL